MSSRINTAEMLPWGNSYLVNPFGEFQKWLISSPSVPGADSCRVARLSGWQKSGNEGPFSAEAEWTSSICAATLVSSLAAAGV